MNNIPTCKSCFWASPHPVTGRLRCLRNYHHPLDVEADFPACRDFERRREEGAAAPAAPAAPEPQKPNLALDLIRHQALLIIRLKRSIFHLVIMLLILAATLLINLFLS